MLTRLSDTMSAQFITRLLIVSYFVALALGLIAGVDTTRLATPIMAPEIAHHAMRAIVLTLCGMVLFDLWRRPAALLLSLVVFWASYISLYSGGDIGAFWRDLALIGALLLTADVAGYADAALSWNTPAVKEDKPPAPEARIPSTPGPEHDSPFREDFDIVRAT